MDGATAEGAPKRAVVKCEKHGLHYDSATQSGCVICRREARGGAPPPASGARLETAAAAGPAPAGGSQPHTAGSMPKALATTAVLLALASLGLYAVHASAAALLHSMLTGVPSPSEELRDAETALDQEMQEFHEDATAVVDDLARDTDREAN